MTFKSGKELLDALRADAREDGDAMFAIRMDEDDPLAELVQAVTLLSRAYDGARVMLGSLTEQAKEWDDVLMTKDLSDQEKKTASKLSMRVALLGMGMSFLQKDVEDGLVKVLAFLIANGAQVDVGQELADEVNPPTKDEDSDE